MTTSADDLIFAQAHHIATRFSTSPAQASAVLLVAYSTAVGDDQPPGGPAFWMALFDASAALLRAERTRLQLHGGDPLLRDLRPLAHLLDLGRAPLPRLER